MCYHLFKLMAISQETIIVTYIGRESLGVWIAIGLLLGRLAAWLGSVTALPLSETSYGISAPFSLATILAIVSFCASLSFIYLEKVYRRTNITAALEKAHHVRKPVSIAETLTFGDAFVSLPA